MSDAATFIEAIAAFTAAIGAICAVGAWPLFGLVVIGLFREEIRLLIGRMRKGKVLGQEFELVEAVSRLAIGGSTLERETEGAVRQGSVHSDTSRYRVRPDVLLVMRNIIWDTTPTEHVTRIDQIFLAEMNEELRRLGRLKHDEFIYREEITKHLDEIGYPKVKREGYSNLLQFSDYLLEHGIENTDRKLLLNYAVANIWVLDSFTAYVNSVVNPTTLSPPSATPASAPKG